MKKNLFILFGTLMLLILLCSCKDEVMEISLQNYRDENYSYDLDDYYYVAEPLEWENYYYAEFGLHLPSESENVKAVLVLIPGHNSNGMRWKDESEWREFAGENNLALVGCYFFGNHEDKQYYLAEGGSGYALVSALEYFAVATGIEKLSTVPVALYGFSDGAIFSFTLACNIPQRTAAFISSKGGYFPFMADELSAGTPGLFIYGEQDYESRNVESINVFYKYRGDNDSQWILLEHKNCGHDVGNESEIVKPFVASICSLRINDVSHQLITLDTESGYLGNQLYKKYWNYSDYPYISKYASWLPNTEFAEVWKSFIKNK